MSGRVSLRAILFYHLSALSLKTIAYYLATSGQFSTLNITVQQYGKILAQFEPHRFQSFAVPPPSIIR